MEKIRLVIYNETYWNKGLIYSQNMIPLKQVADKIGAEFEVISFTSLIMYFRKRNLIKQAKIQLRSEGIIVKDRYVLTYPHNLFFPRLAMIPYLYLNIFIYVLLLACKDRHKNVVSFLRSYPPALFFSKFYPNHKNLIFDTRTDWLEENVNLGRMKKNSYTYKYWQKNLKNIVTNFRKTLSISDICQTSMCENLAVDKSFVDVVYNPIDYNHFYAQKIDHKGYNFLYTGSLGNWNKLENYLDVFCAFYKEHLDSKFIICTGTNQKIVEEILSRSEYSDVHKHVEVHYNVPYKELPQIYSLCDFGFQLMATPDSRVGVKFVEYIAAGIIPIINENVRGAAFLSKKYGIGVVLSVNDSDAEIVSKIECAATINSNSANYKAFRSKTDVDSIVNAYLSLVI
jgi:glycosyltransferase involved in cell wall biosynthesis